MINQDSPYADRQRDGLDKLVNLARTICSLLRTFAPIIQSKYSGNVAIIGLLTAAQALCEALPEAIAEFDALGADDGLPPADPSTTLGINENADAPPPPQDLPAV